ncbi:hypothetical protein BTVI_93025 [Pitangus sulphuratus]|nr:hypothetical protein BTVI_93025 [Pitangus sulphuratus]
MIKFKISVDKWKSASKTSALDMKRADFKLLRELVQPDWKLVNVVLIFKKGKKEDPGNYRLVSLTSVPTRIIEKIILGSTGKHLEGNGHSQHGFIRKSPVCQT